MKTSSTVDRTRWRRLVPPFASFLLLLLCASPGFAVFGEDEEKPKPEFVREGEQLTAKLVPRGKRTSIQITFAVTGGKLQSVETKDFAEAERPEVDRKDFRSGLFVVKVDGFAPGAEVEVAVASNYFTGSTEFWVFNPKAATAWAKIEAKHARLAQKVEELRATVKDGGPLDSDGEVNGEIVLLCGPMDTFWGYAIGTLVIRFFGVFLVLAVLQIGMQVASRVFRLLEARAARATTEAAAAVAALPSAFEGAAPPVDAGIAAAIGLALRLHLSAQEAREPLQLSTTGVSAWTLHGRDRIMGERFLVFDRSQRPDSTRLAR
jgi:hypothetical protein